jgi:hypothetical protein
MIQLAEEVRPDVSSLTGTVDTSLAEGDCWKPEVEWSMSMMTNWSIVRRRVRTLVKLRVAVTKNVGVEWSNLYTGLSSLFLK